MTTVAVIDNDRDLVALMSELLVARGLTPATAATLTAAREVIRQQDPVLILLDMWLETPEAGWTLLHDLRAHPQTAHIPIVVVTGGLHLLSDERVLWLRTHHVTVLSKPFDLDEFDRCVEAAIPRPRE